MLFCSKTIKLTNYTIFGKLCIAKSLTNSVNNRSLHILYSNPKLIYLAKNQLKR